MTSVLIAHPLQPCNHIEIVVYVALQIFGLRQLHRVGGKNESSHGAAMNPFKTRQKECVTWISVKLPCYL